MKQTEFDLGLGKQYKEDGKAVAAESREDLLNLAQRLADEIARRHPNYTCDADKVQEALIDRGYIPDDLGNAAGSIFDSRKWNCIGWKPSTRASRHANKIGIWQLRRISL